MPTALLTSIKWHDLPVATLAITECGIELVVTPWIESADAYARYALRITAPENLHLDVNGALSAKDFGNLEVSKFDYTVSQTERVSGTIGILPGGAGFWTISFVNAVWSFETV
jgi:hypothetical protein